MSDWEESLVYGQVHPDRVTHTGFCVALEAKLVEGRLEYSIRMLGEVPVSILGKDIYIIAEPPERG